MEKEKGYPELIAIEKEFKVLIHKDRQNWIRAAKLLDRIESSGLFQIRATSFTQYVRWIAHENNINVSTLWRARSAARTYCQIKGISLEEVYEKSVKSTPEQLEYFGKVQTIAPAQLVDQVRERMLKGEKVRHELKNLWQTYRPLKRGQTERGRKPKPREGELFQKVNADQFHVPYSEKESESNEDIKAQRYLQSLLDAEKLNKYHATPDELTEANLKHALKATFWMQAHVETKEHDRFHALVETDMEIWKPDQPQRITLPAVGFSKRKNVESGMESYAVFSVCLALSKTFRWASKAHDISFFGDFCYLIVPQQAENLANALEVAPPSVGILTVDKSLTGKNFTLKIARIGKRQAIDADYRSAVISGILKRKLGWEETKKAS